MPSDRNYAELALPGDATFDDQRLVLLELLVDPPANGDRVIDLATALRRPPAAVAAAADELVSFGLAERADDRIRASATARAFDRLWPVCL